MEIIVFNGSGGPCSGADVKVHRQDGSVYTTGCTDSSGVFKCAYDSNSGYVTVNGRMVYSGTISGTHNVTV
ncbi:hypothetical protein FACS189419_07620 [Planctomycetales bacterium]|nr:hypothetical protein FACS189419_07620 [Planctomycetales bacterium]